ncbi:hypothetical protein BpHYR1_042103 [Brachionus plicatilis]|uniref:Zinc finger BED domain-containing 1-like n=1 Tax=Brachionus plicatilis TaxID=10195 RepID=A0A3M7PVR2_BRAPC|nr:hypothetical protein BpHYR1_042103 [Brachionus plicatilis]
MSIFKQNLIEPIESVTFTVDQMLEMSTKNKFPKRTFLFEISFGIQKILNQLSNPCFKDILNSSIMALSYHKIRNLMLPEVMVKFFNHIESKLKHAANISLVVDIWTNRVSANFIALGAVLFDFNFNRQLKLIDMQRINGGHCSENIQIAIEYIINKYCFDYRKIVGKCSLDEGPSLVRLFGQLLDQRIIFGDDDVVQEPAVELITFSNIMDNNADPSTTDTDLLIIENNLEGVSALPDAASITKEINNIKP